VPKSENGRYVIEYQNYDGKRVGTAEKMEVDVVIGGDGANSRLAKAMGKYISHISSISRCSLLNILLLNALDAGEYNYAIAFQERIKISDEQMAFYEELAEMYVGDDVSPDFYGW